MEFDEGIDKISEWVTLDREFVREDFPINIEEVFPIGWKKFARVIETASFLTYDLPQLKHHVHVKIEKGLLRISSALRSENYQEVFNRVSNSVARDTSLVCMVCGKRGHRRKEEVGWPSLCTTHYVQYVNYLDTITQQ
jgi:hypothetical protein